MPIVCDLGLVCCRVRGASPRAAAHPPLSAAVWQPAAAGGRQQGQDGSSGQTADQAAAPDDAADRDDSVSSVGAVSRTASHDRRDWQDAEHCHHEEVPWKPAAHAPCAMLQGTAASLAPMTRARCCMAAAPSIPLELTRAELPVVKTPSPSGMPDHGELLTCSSPHKLRRSAGSSSSGGARAGRPGADRAVGCEVGAAQVAAAAATREHVQPRADETLSRPLGPLHQVTRTWSMAALYTSYPARYPAANSVHVQSHMWSVISCRTLREGWGDDPDGSPHLDSHAAVSVGSSASGKVSNL